MQMLDTVTTPEGTGAVVGLPDHDTVEVRLHDEGRTLRMFRREAVKLAKEKNGNTSNPKVLPEKAKLAPKRSESTEKVLQDNDDVPLSKSGRPLSGAALARYRAKKEGQ